MNGIFFNHRGGADGRLPPSKKLSGYKEIIWFPTLVWDFGINLNSISPLVRNIFLRTRIKVNLCWSWIHNQIQDDQCYKDLSDQVRNEVYTWKWLDKTKSLRECHLCCNVTLMFKKNYCVLFFFCIVLFFIRGLNILYATQSLTTIPRDVPLFYMKNDYSL